MQAQAPRFMFSLPVVHMIEVKEGPGRARRFDEDIKASEATEESGEGFGGREQTVQHGGLSGEWSPDCDRHIAAAQPLPSGKNRSNGYQWEKVPRWQQSTMPTAP